MRLVKECCERLYEYSKVGKGVEDGRTGPNQHLCGRNGSRLSLPKEEYKLRETTVSRGSLVKRPGSASATDQRSP